MIKNKVKFSNEQVEQMKTLYAKTERLTKVAKEFNITPKLAKQILVENGVKVRKIGNKITCQKCGATFSNPDDDIIFCSRCGTKIQSEKEKAMETISEAMSMCGSFEAQTAWLYIKKILED